MIREKDLAEWLDNPVTQLVAKANKRQAEAVKHQICAHFWETGEDHPDRVYLKARIEMLAALTDPKQQRSALNEWLEVEINETTD